MRPLRQIVDDLINLAQELEQVSNLFSTGVAQEGPKKAPFVQGVPETLSQKRSRAGKLSGLARAQSAQMSPVLGEKADEAQKLLIRQLWFSTPTIQQTIGRKREIAKQVRLSVQTVAIVIRRTPPQDLASFLKNPVRSSPGQGNTSSTSSLAARPS